MADMQEPVSEVQPKDTKSLPFICDSGHRLGLWFDTCPKCGAEVYAEIPKKIVTKEELRRQYPDLNSLWGLTYDFLHNRDKELCEEWDELVNQWEAEYGVIDLGLDDSDSTTKATDTPQGDN